MYDAPCSEDKSSDELECFANMATAVQVLAAKLLELICGVSLVSHFKMGSSPQSDSTDKSHGCELQSEAATQH